MNDKIVYGAAERSQQGRKLRLIHSTADKTSREKSHDPAIDSRKERQAHLCAELTSSIFADGSAIAAALATAHADGSIGLSIIGVEPEHALQLADGLDQLSQRLRLHAQRESPKPRHQGSTSLAIVFALGFAALTYVNDIAWIDAALSVAAQLTSAWIAQTKTKHIRRRQSIL
ncbi:hypothetical protein PQQ51_06060 [Paraburkholderia xenovorans]|uniref:hypothetical protein n=1 Tax=Paraburkholderia xenovorans TaxID=36873 RepID=UPI0038BBD3DA